jgi:hypothetical protein
MPLRRTNGSHRLGFANQTTYPGKEEVMTSKTKRPGSEMLDRALKNYEQTLRVGLKLQEQVGDWWTSTVTQTAATHEFQKQFKSVADELMTPAQKQIEEFFALVEQTNRAAVDVFKKSIEMAQKSSQCDRQSKVTEAWEESLNAVKSSAESIADINQKVFDSWVSIMKKNAAEMGEPFAAAKP